MKQKSRWSWFFYLRSNSSASFCSKYLYRVRLLFFLLSLPQTEMELWSFQAHMVKKTTNTWKKRKIWYTGHLECFRKLRSMDHCYWSFSTTAWFALSVESLIHFLWLLGHQELISKSLNSPPNQKEPAEVVRVSSKHAL